MMPEYVTFRRLIKLCYGTTFIKEGDRDLDVSELVRLIHVANAFECMDAVKECATALTNLDLDWEGALQCIELTDMLKDVEGMEDLGVKAGDVLAKEVGPVHKLFTPAKDGEDEGDVLGGLKLSSKVKVSIWPRYLTMAYIKARAQLCRRCSLHARTCLLQFSRPWSPQTVFSTQRRMGSSGYC
jgi:hypothetical protein